MVGLNELNEALLSDKNFKRAFWYWFDNNTTKKERDKFRYYPSDMSEIYFYNQIYRKILLSNIN